MLSFFLTQFFIFLVVQKITPFVSVQIFLYVTHFISVPKTDYRQIICIMVRHDSLYFNTNVIYTLFGMKSAVKI